jgi:hypothetical protein
MWGRRAEVQIRLKNHVSTNDKEVLKRDGVGEVERGRWECVDRWRRFLGGERE